jgi:hypothetical protein
MYLKERKSDYSKGISPAMFTAALFTIAKLWKKPKCPTADAWILYTMCVIFIYNGILFGQKEE